MTDSSNAPLHLFQVLEEEYANLAEGAALSEEEKEETITLRGRSVVAKMDWKFYAGHVKDTDGLIRKLEHDPDLYPHLSSVLPGLQTMLVEHEGISKTEAIENTLNLLLKLPIYDEEAFKHANLKDTTLKSARKKMALSPFIAKRLVQKTIQLITKVWPSATESDDELAHINRLILEETFPKELERISDIRLTAMYQRLHREKVTALSLSGGGIRSGTFALGLIQRLARFGLLDKFDYLSTVSGGGYIGGWLTAWLHRHPRGLDGVIDDLKNDPVRSKIDPDPRSIQHLREYSNFLTPKSGLLTADTWTFVAIYLRNLTLNWFVLIPLLIATLAIPRLLVALNRAQPIQTVNSAFGQSLSEGLGGALGVRHLLLVIGAALLIMAIMYVCLNRPGINQLLIERSPFWRNRMRQDGFLVWCLLPTVLSAVLLTVYLSWSLENQAFGQHDGPEPWWVTYRPWMYVGAGASVPTLAYAGYLLVLDRWKPRHWKEFNWREVFGAFFMIVVGAVGGYLAYRASISPSLDPIVQNVDQSWQTEIYTCIAVPLLLLVLLLSQTLFIGGTSRLQGIEDEDREWWSRCNAWFLIAMLGWAALNTVVIFGPLLVFASPKIIASLGGISGVVALLAGKSSKTPANSEQASQQGMLSEIVSEWLLPILAFLFLVVFIITLSLGTTVLIRTLAATNASNAGFAFGTDAGTIGNMLDSIEHMRVIHYTRFSFILGFLVIAAVIGLAMGWMINLNKFSLHAGYRNRLIRGFLGASRDPRMRNPNPFTGFDPQDNIQMHELRAALFHENDFRDIENLAAEIERAEDDLSRFLKEHLSDETQTWLSGYTADSPLEAFQRKGLIEDLNRILEDEKVVVKEGRLEEVDKPNSLQTIKQVIRKRLVLTTRYPNYLVAKFPPPQRLLHVVNMTLNLVGGKNLAWQQRKAEPFISTPLHSGCFRVGYRKSRFYGGKDGISLGTAAGISGAAASSNMGYYTSSPVLSMVLTLFNVRLGWWLGNPGPAGDTTFNRSSPKLSITPVISEALGLTDDTSKYVYLTDGGHFENLAVYEMVLRRCHIIVVSDAAADGDYEFGDLGNAIRKIRIDLGVPIEFDEVPIYKNVPEGKTGRYWAFARIGYSDVDGEGVEDGILVYIKPAIYGNEPRDVVQYKATHATFPHQSTADQFFDEPQFESYRALGAYIMEQMCTDRYGDDESERSLTLEQFIELAYQNYRVPVQAVDQLNDIGWLDAWIDRRRND